METISRARRHHLPVGRIANRDAATRIHMHPRWLSRRMDEMPELAKLVDRRARLRGKSLPLFHYDEALFFLHVAAIVGEDVSIESARKFMDEVEKDREKQSREKTHLK